MMTHSPRDRRLHVPREHGLYIVLVTSWIVGILLSSEPDRLAAAALLVGPLAGVMLTGPALEWGRRRRAKRTYAPSAGAVGWVTAMALLLIGSVIVLVATASSALWPLVAGGAIIVPTLLPRARRWSLLERALLGFLASAALAPAVMMSGTVPGVGELVALWLALALYFATSVAAVRYRMRGEGLAVVTVTHLIAVVGIILLVHLSLAPSSLLVAIVPLVLRLLMIIGDAERFRAFSLKRVGLIESGIGLLFVIGLAIVQLSNGRP